jgi:hypothetical protein
LNGLAAGEDDVLENNSCHPGRHFQRDKIVKTGEPDLSRALFSFPALLAKLLLRGEKFGS